jgi:hypothetical protein
MQENPWFESLFPVTLHRFMQAHAPFQPGSLHRSHLEFNGKFMMSGDDISNSFGL